MVETRPDGFWAGVGARAGRLFGRQTTERLAVLVADVRTVVGSFSGRNPPAVIRTGVRAPRWSAVAGGRVPRPLRAERGARPETSKASRDPGAPELLIVAGGEDAARDVATASASVTFIDGGQHHAIVQARGQTLLEAAEAAGLNLIHSCRSGGCAACRVRVVRGRVVMPETHCLNVAELAAGHALTCVGCADGEVVLEVE